MSTEDVVHSIIEKRVRTVGVSCYHSDLGLVHQGQFNDDQSVPGVLIPDTSIANMLRIVELEDLVEGLIDDGYVLVQGGTLRTDSRAMPFRTQISLVARQHALSMRTHDLVAAYAAFKSSCRQMKWDSRVTYLSPNRQDAKIQSIAVH